MEMQHKIQELLSDIKTYYTDDEYIEIFENDRAIVEVISNIIVQTPRNSKCDSLFDCLIKDFWFRNDERKFTVLHYNVFLFGKELEICYFLLSHLEDINFSRYFVDCGNWSVLLKKQSFVTTIVSVKNFEELKKDISLFKLMS